MNVGAVNGGMATRSPAGTLPQESGMRRGADVNLTGLAMLHLGVAAQAEIRVALGQHLSVHGTVRVVANGATFAQGFMFENERAGLFAVALRTVFVQARHGEAACGLKDILAVRVVTLDAIHPPFNNWMMLGQTELGLGLEMALKTGGGLLAGIDDEFATAAAGLDMLAAGSMARFASGLTAHLRGIHVDAGVGAGGKVAGNIGVTIVASSIADVSCSRDFRRRHHRAREGRAGIEQQSARTDPDHRADYGQSSFQILQCRF